MKRFFLIIMAAVVILTGCSPIENRLDKRLIIQGVGIDFEDGTYKITAMYMDTSNPVGEGDVTSKFAEGSGKSVLAALTDTVNRTGREPLYGQCSFIILGESITKNGIKEPLEFFTDYYEFHPNINIFCADTSANKIMNCENMNDRLMDDFSDSETTTGKTISSTLSDVYSSLIDGRSSAITSLVGIEHEDVVLKGGAAFNGDKLGSTLTSEECMATLLICGDAKSVWDIFPSDNEESINYSLSDCHSSISAVTDGEMKFDINICANAGAYATDSDGKTQAKISSRIKSLCDSTINRLLKQEQLDVFNLQRELYRQDYGFYKDLADPSHSVLLSKINVSVDIKLKR